MRYSDIYISSRAHFQASDPEYIIKYKLYDAGGSLTQFIADHSVGNAKDKTTRIYEYKGKTKQGVERFKTTTPLYRSTQTEEGELLFIPETHQLFNCYIIKKIVYELFVVNGNLTRMSEEEFEIAILISVDVSNK